MTRTTKYLIVMIALLLSPLAYGQDRFAGIQSALENAKVDFPGLDETVEITVSGTSVQEFVRAIGLSHRLNISVDPNIEGTVVNNFANANVADVILFLCKNYDLDLDLTGSIMHLKRFIPPPEPEKPVVIVPPKVEYTSATDFLSLDLKRDTLDAVAEEITKKTGRNVVLAPGIGGKRVSVFIQNRPFDNALEKMAFANGLIMTKTSDLFYLLEELPKVAKTEKGLAGNLSHSEVPDLVIKVTDGELLTVEAREVLITDILQGVSNELLKNFFLYDRPEESATLHIEGATYEQFLSYLLNGSGYTYKNSDNVYLIGQRNLEGLRKTELIRLENRTVENILEFIPEELKKNVTIQEFLDLNGLIVSGSNLKIEEIKSFLRQVDQLVPVVMIEVMIVDVNRNRTLSTGITAGVGDPPTQSGGTLLPGVDYTLTSSTINDLINSFNGFGVFNLGNVTPDFYMSIQALETDGMLKMRSTPQLSTLNGHEATMSIGETEYYLEVRNDLIGTQNPTLSTSQVYNPINADLSLTIKPMVSSDGQVTLEVEVTQSNFTERIADTAPPGSVQRTFQSVIRAEDGDMIVLGGLEEKEMSQSGRGTPFLSRIPILKWIFSSRTKTKSRSKLTIFIKPSIIY